MAEIEVSVTVDGDEVYRLLPGDAVRMPRSAATTDLVLAALAEAISSITGHRNDFVDEMPEMKKKKAPPHLELVSKDG